MNILCDVKSLCPSPDAPITNLSTEDPDRDVFVGYANDPWQPPPINVDTGDQTIPGWCEDPTSALYAALCAQKDNNHNTINGGSNTPGYPTPNDPSRPINTPDGPPTVGRNTPGQPGQPPGPPSPECNDEITCFATCPDGSTVPHVFPSCVVESTTKNKANAIAQQFCNLLAQMGNICLGSLDDSTPLCLDEDWTDSLDVTGGVGTKHIHISGGQLPPGLNFEQVDDSSAEITGTPDTPGHYDFTVEATDSATPTPNKNSRAYAYDVFGITTEAKLPTLIGDQAYSAQLDAGGGTAPYAFALAAGSSLTSPLVLSPAGLISGTVPNYAIPCLGDDDFFDVSVTDADGNVCTKTFAIPQRPKACADPLLPLRVEDMLWLRTLYQDGGLLSRFATQGPSGAAGQFALGYTATGGLHKCYNDFGKFFYCSFGANVYTRYAAVMCNACSTTKVRVQIHFEGFVGQPGPGGGINGALTLDGNPLFDNHTDPWDIDRTIPLTVGIHTFEVISQLVSYPSVATDEGSIPEGTVMVWNPSKQLISIILTTLP